MQITRESDYATRLVLALASRPRGAVVPLREVARAYLIPQPMLRKIARRLAAGGLIATFRGPRGGVRLERRPASITLRHVIEAVEGPIRLNRCLVRARVCPLQTWCAVHPAWVRIQDVLLRELDLVTFDRLAATQANAS